MTKSKKVKSKKAPVVAFNVEAEAIQEEVVLEEVVETKEETAFASELNSCNNSYKNEEKFKAGLTKAIENQIKLGGNRFLGAEVIIPIFIESIK